MRERGSNSFWIICRPSRIRAGLNADQYQTSSGHMKKTANKLTLPRKNMAIQVGIVDDDERVRTSLAQAVDRFPGCTCTGQYSSGEEAVGHFQKQSPPKVVLMDINMPGMGGIECARQIKDAHPDTEIIMLTAYQDTDMVFKSLAAGASGYLLKRADREELVSAIHQVINGGSPMTSHIARKVVQAFRTPTQTEKETTKNFHPANWKSSNCCRKVIFTKKFPSPSV